MNWVKKTTFIFLGMMIVVLSCSHHKKQQVLSFFFDGVEESDTTSSVELQYKEGVQSDHSQLQNLQATQSYFYHAIYQQKECSACHDRENANKLIEDLPDLCYQCHADFSEEYEFLHVPVAMGECGSCHHPHLAKNEKLLIADIQTLCFSCHDPDELRATETHSEIGETSCSDCHNPHGGEDEYLFN